MVITALPRENNVRPLFTHMSTIFGCILYMTVLGTNYCIGCLGPYLQAYFRVGSTETQMLFPSVILLQTLFMPLGSQLMKRIRARYVILAGSSVCILGLLICSIQARDQFYSFYAIYTVGYATMLAGTYMVPI